MPLPGAELNIRAVAGGAGDPSDTGAAFMLGQVPRGPLLFEVSSYRQLVEIGGPAPANGVLHQAAEAAFAAGLSRLFVLRVVGAAAVAASQPLAASDEITSLTVTASSVGGWGNGLKVEVAAVGPSSRRLIVTLDGAVVEQSPIASSRQELLDWAAAHARYVALAAGASDQLPAVVAATALAGGSEDDASLTVSNYEAALARITRDHPVGQILAPGVHAEQIQLALLEKAKDPTDERFAVLDCDPTHDVGQKIAAAGVLRASGNGAAGALVAQRVRVPAPGGGVRWVPGSAIYAGRTAATDALAGPGQVPAGETFGESPVMLDVDQTFTEDERERLNEAGITVIASINGAPRIYGGRTLADGRAQEAWRWVSGWRVTMRIARRGREVLERYVLKRRDGRNSILIGASMDLQTMLEQERLASNVFGEASGEGYVVDTSIPRVNTEAGLREGYLRGEVQFDVPGVAERVVFDVGVSAAGTTNSN